MLRSILREFVRLVLPAMPAFMPAMRRRVLACGLRRWALFVLIGLLPLQSIAATLQITCAALAQTASGNPVHAAASAHYGTHASPFVQTVAHHEHAGGHHDAMTADPALESTESDLADFRSWDSAHHSGSCAACALCCLSAAVIVSLSTSHSVPPATGVIFAPVPPLLVGVIPPGIERPPRH